jgi:hypothetical protein
MHDRHSVGSGDHRQCEQTSFLNHRLPFLLHLVSRKSVVLNNNQEISVIEDDCDDDNDGDDNDGDDKLD